ncbi:response regulator transcription factor [Luteipulveratus mongoliensis]|uniref:LuxR family transcriptional regulator n=1 Tax=Luteipulveratus mongoliensis TaxID=571913 RepID=A0A0K1JGZ2_9MICO|nr:response regulator transcription factor [Luteipulveratus mongoliensis]AKU15855.1 LuxR family transcriptional regulator [Luteipulveratus mongoliensis]
MSDKQIRVLLADDQRVVREGLRMVLELLEVEVVAEAADGVEALELVERHAPEVVLMDLRMPRCDGVEATRAIAERWPGLPVVILTTYSDDRSVLDALRAGAVGYLTKDAGGVQILEALRRAIDDQPTLDLAVQRHLIDAVAKMPAAGTPDVLIEPLTTRESEVLRLIAEGLANPEIAERLVISEGTVKTHVNRVFAKLGVTHRAQAVSYAFRNGLA